MGYPSVIKPFVLVILYKDNFTEANSQHIFFANFNCMHLAKLFNNSLRTSGGYFSFYRLGTDWLACMERAHLYKRWLHI